MVLKQVVIVILITLTLSINYISPYYQYALHAGNGSGAAPVYVSSYDKSGNNYVTGVYNYLQFYTRISGLLVNPYIVTTLTVNTIIDAKFKDDGLWVAAIDNSSSLYLLNIPAAGTQFVVNQSLNTIVIPTSLTWANRGNKLIVGLDNGTLSVYNLNITTNQFFLRQTIPNAHIGSVAKVDGEISRVVSCGTTDTTIAIFNYNITFDLYQLNQTLNSSVIGCTALDLA
jgi:hypothetical protein